MAREVKTELTEEQKQEIERKYLSPMRKSIMGVQDEDNVILTKQKNGICTTSTPPIEPSVLNEQAEQAVPKRLSGKQRKASLEEYRQTFLRVPKIEDRKTVFVSGEVRDRLDEIVRKLAGRKMSVSGLLENLAVNHLETYAEDIEVWKRL